MNLTDHWEKISGLFTRFSCSHCSSLFSTMREFDEHVCSTERMQTRCTVCEEKFNNRSSFLDHFKQTHLKNQNICMFCCIKYTEEEMLLRHCNGHAKAIPPAEERRMLNNDDETQKEKRRVGLRERTTETQSITKDHDYIEEPADLPVEENCGKSLPSRKRVLEDTSNEWSLNKTPRIEKSETFIPSPPPLSFYGECSDPPSSDLPVSQPSSSLPPPPPSSLPSHSLHRLQILSDQILTAARLDSVIDSGTGNAPDGSQFPSTLPTSPPSIATLPTLPSSSLPSGLQMAVKLEQVETFPLEKSLTEINQTPMPPPSPLSNPPLNKTPPPPPPPSSSSPSMPLEVIDRSPVPSFSLLSVTSQSSSTTTGENHDEPPMEQGEKRQGKTTGESSASLSEEDSSPILNVPTSTKTREEIDTRETSSSGVSRDEGSDDGEENGDDQPTPSSHQEQLQKETEMDKETCVAGNEREVSPALPISRGEPLDNHEGEAVNGELSSGTENEGIPSSSASVIPLRCSPRKHSKKKIKEEHVDDTMNEISLPHSSPTTRSMKRNDVNPSPIPQLRRSPRKREKTIEKEAACSTKIKEEAPTMPIDDLSPQRRRRSSRNSPLKTVKQERNEMVNNNESPCGSWDDQLDWKDIRSTRPRRSVKIEPKEEEFDADREFWSGTSTSPECPRCKVKVGKGGTARKNHFKQFHYDSFFNSFAVKMSEVERWVSCRIGASSSGAYDGRVCLFCPSDDQLHDGRVALLRHVKKCHKSDFLHLKTAYRLYARTRKIDDLPVHNILN